jgi:hypothetical protein
MAVRLIQERSAEPLTIAGLARAVGMRRRRFTSPFGIRLIYGRLIDEIRRSGHMDASRTIPTCAA